MKRESKSNVATLRQKAEELLEERLLKSGPQRSKVQAKNLIHEFEVCQIEMELLDEELKLAKEQAKVVSRKYFTERKKAEDGRLEISEERYRLLYENAKIGLYRTTPDGTIVLANQALVKMLGYPSFEELAKRNVEQDGFETPHQRKAFLEKIEQTGEVENFESTWIRRDRTPVFVRESARAIRDTKGNTLYYDGTVEDITERKQAKEAHRTSEKRLHEFNELQGLLLPPNPIEQKLKLITDAVVRIMGADFARIWMIKPGDRCNTGCIHAQVTEGPHVCRFREKCLHLMASSGSYTHTNGQVHARVPFGCYKIGKVAAAEDSKFLTNNVTTDPRVHDNAWAKELGLVSFAGYRLVDVNGTPLGVLALFSKKAISEEDDSFLEGIAHSTSRVLHSSWVEAALRDSEERYRALFETSLDGISLLDLSGKIVFANNQVVKLFGYNQPSEFIGLNGFGLIHPEDKPKMDFYFKEFMTTGVITNCEVRSVKKDGSEFIGEYSATLIKNANGNPVYMMDVVRDITGRKRVEEALRESEARYRLLFEKSADGILIVDVETKTIKYANPALCRMLGYTEMELTTLGLADIHPKDDLQRVFAEFESLARGDKTLAPDIPCLRKDGSIVYADINSSSITIEGRAYNVGLFRDITARKQAEEALQKSELRFKLISENAQESIWEVDNNGLYTYISPVIKELLGYEAEEIIGLKYFYDLFEPENKEEMKQGALGAFARKESFRNFINCNIHKDGRKVILSTSGVPILDKENNLIGYRGVDVDITERIHAEESLRQSEIKLQVIIESTADGILAIDGNGKVIKTNNRFAELWKIPPAVLNSGDDATLLNFVLEQLISPKQFLDKVQQLYNSTDEDSDTLFFKDGRIFERYSAPLILDDKIMGRVWSFRDITERKRAEEALCESKNIIQNIIDNSPSLIYILDLDGKFILANRKLAEVLNFSAEKLLGKTRQHFMPKEFANQHRNNDLQIINSEQAAIYEEEILESDGQHIYLTQKFPLFDSDGKLYTVGGISTDITERKIAEEKINMLAHAVKNSADCIAITDKDYKIIFVNDSFSKVYGFEKEEIVGQPISVITSKNNLPEVGHSLYSAMAKNEVWSGEVLNKRKDGNDFPVQLSLAPVITDKGELIAIVGVLRDITERRQAEAELKLKNEQLLKLNAEKDKFFSIISHDLRSPFNSFLGLTQIMAEDLPSLTLDQIQEFSVSIRNSATNLYRLLGNLLQWSRMQQGSIPFNPELLQLRPVAEDCIAIAIESAKNKGIGITYDIPDDLKIFADNNMLQTVIRNLVSNAVKFTHKGGKVNISAKTTKGPKVEISVSDTGIGMSQIMVSNLFRLDFQSNRKGTDGEPSTGLGLLLCKEFVEKHGGKIWVESEEDKGTTFYFNIPECRLEMEPT